MYVQAVAEAAPASVAAYEGAASRIAGECPSVLAGAPQESVLGPEASSASRTGRQRGEAKRQRTQLSDLQNEIALSLQAAEEGPILSLRVALLAKLKALSASNAALAQAIHTEVLGLEDDLQLDVRDVCADIKVWVGSGYKVLASATRTLAQHEEAQLAELSSRFAGQSGVESLALMDDAADRALVRKTLALELQTIRTVSSSIESASKRLNVALGLGTHEQELESLFRESKSSIKIGAGRTATGTTYTVWVERHKGSSISGCRVDVEAQEGEGSESEICLSASGSRSAPGVMCGQGLLTIQGQVLSAARTVVLRMSNGKQIVSHPTLVPRRLGGPAAFYYQVVRGPSPIPVSLTERDAHGQTLRVARLERIVGCTTHPLKYLPGGKRTLLSGQVPRGGLHFSILGERYRLFGRAYSRLTLTTGTDLEPPAAGPAEGAKRFGEEGGDEQEEGGPVEGSGGPLAMFVKSRMLLSSRTSTGCQPHEYSIFYGQLKKSRDTVLARVEGKLVSLHRVRIPASIHAGGVLVYLVSSGEPEEIVVRSPSGNTVVSENRSKQTTEGREMCEGESEGTGPPPGALGGIGDETSRIRLSG